MIDPTFVGGGPSPRPVGPAPRPYVPASGRRTPWTTVLLLINTVLVAVALGWQTHDHWPSPGPVPPAPTPVPPGPTPIPPPIPGPGLRVLVVYESGDLSRLPAGQMAALYSKTFRDLLNAKCAVGPDGKTREWRIFDADVDLSGESDTWKAAMSRPRKSLPWIVVSNGTTGHEGPFPATADEAVKLVEKYAGG
jgi:hypothetical protein